MICPQCSTPLQLAQRQGVEIDVCPQCRGVWLDRGELDKILARSNAFDDDDHDDPRYHHPEDRRHHNHPRRKSFWQELFD